MSASNRRKDAKLSDVSRIRRYHARKAGPRDSATVSVVRYDGRCRRKDTAARIADDVRQKVSGTRDGAVLIVDFSVHVPPIGCRQQVSSLFLVAFRPGLEAGTSIRVQRPEFGDLGGSYAH